MAAHRGERHHKSKLTTADVRRIRITYARGGVTYEALAHEYDVEPSSIGDIIRRNTWRHI
ncbi:hypothetical protein [Streptomyces sp. NPDC015131]|uniref:hypothetical protein n=1 Tax=Streptomyces sp. NPDC015131 TaxID=3364941 RepID=UPI0036F94E73